MKKHIICPIGQRNRENKILKRSVYKRSRKELPMENTYQIPVWKKYTLTVEEAAAYFRIGENKLRNLINENKNANYLLWNGNRVQIKRELFEKFVDTLEAI